MSSASAPIPPFPPKLRELGAGPERLDETQHAALERDGFLLLPGHIAADDLDQLRIHYDRLMREKYEDAAAITTGGQNDFWHHETGTRRLTDLLSEAEIFVRIATDPVFLTVSHLLLRGPIKHDSINAREPLRGQGHQGLHQDGPPVTDGRAYCVNSAWLLDDFRADNGPTRIIPGSHRWAHGLDGHDCKADHTLQRLMAAAAGSVLIFSGSVWHGGTVNQSGAPRRVVHSSIIRRDHDLGPRAQRLRIRKATWDRLSPAARWLFDV